MYNEEFTNNYTFFLSPVILALIGEGMYAEYVCCNVAHTSVIFIQLCHFF